MAEGKAGGSHSPELGADGDWDTAFALSLLPFHVEENLDELHKMLAEVCVLEGSQVCSRLKSKMLLRKHMVLRQQFEEHREYLPRQVDLNKKLLKRGQVCSKKRMVDADKYCRFVPDWTIKKGTWEEFVVKVLHIVRLHQITEFDPVQGHPVYTRFCRYNLAFFDFEKESKAERGKPFLELTSYDRKLLEGSVNVVSLKIHESKVGYPIRVFGTVLVRDQVDYKCVYLFRRGKNDPQLINSPDDMLTLTDPCRGLAVTCSMFFEINLKIEGDSGEIIFSKGVMEHDACVHEEKLETKLLTSWHSTIRLDYTPVPVALIATITVRVLNGTSVFNGEVTAWTSGNKNEIILHDSKVAGTPTELGNGGSVMLTRRLIAVPLNEKLVVRILVQDAIGHKAACFESALGNLDNSRTFFQDPYMLDVKAEWSGNTKRKNVYRYAGRHIKLLL